MSPDLIWMCFTLAALLLLAWAWYGACREDQRQWRTSTQVRADVAQHRAWRHTQPAIETEPGDPYSDDRIAAELIYIPRQRTEDHR